MQILASLAIMVLSATLSILVLAFGWGLEPKSWAWIIGGALASMLLMVIITALQHPREK